MSSHEKESKNLKKIKKHLLITRYSPQRVERGEMLSFEDIQEILSLDSIGVIPESSSILKSSNAGTPVVLDKKSSAGQAYNDMVDRLLGVDKSLRFVNYRKKGLIRRILGI